MHQREKLNRSRTAPLTDSVSFDTDGTFQLTIDPCTAKTMASGPKMASDRLVRIGPEECTERLSCMTKFANFDTDYCVRLHFDVYRICEGSRGPEMA